MITAKQAKQQTETNLKSKCNIIPKQKLLPINKSKEYYISLPFTLVTVEVLIKNAIEFGCNFCKMHNEITEYAERCLIKNGYKVTWYKRFIKVSW